MLGSLYFFAFICHILPMNSYFSQNPEFLATLYVKGSNFRGFSLDLVF